MLSKVQWNVTVTLCIVQWIIFVMLDLCPLWVYISLEKSIYSVFQGFLKKRMVCLRLCICVCWTVDRIQKLYCLETYETECQLSASGAYRLEEHTWSTCLVNICCTFTFLALFIILVHLQLGCNVFLYMCMWVFLLSVSCGYLSWNSVNEAVFVL